MPPRFSYWTIIAGGLPTAFRAAEREELLPTFTRLKEKQPDAEMKWFARGKLWSSPEEARDQRERRVESRDGKNRHRDREQPGRREGGGEARGRDWRPGGDHRDPRQQFKDAKKARNQRFKAEKFARKTGRHDGPRERPHGDPLAPDRRPEQRGPRHTQGGNDRNGWTPTPRGKNESGWRARPPAHDRNSSTSTRGESGGPARGAKPHGPAGAQGARRDWKSKPPPENARRDSLPRERPHGDPLAPDRRPRQDGSRHGGAGGDRNRWAEKPRGGRDENWRRPPAHDRDSGRSERREPERQNRGPKPHLPSGPQGGRREWAAKPPREKPHGDKLGRPARPSGPSGQRDSGGYRGPRNDARGNQPTRSGDAQGTYRGQGHGDNSWKPKPPREDRDGGARSRPFGPRGFDRDRARGDASSEPTPPPRPRGPNREPRPSDTPAPDAPPRPDEPVITPPGPPERGRLNRNKRSR